MKEGSSILIVGRTASGPEAVRRNVSISAVDTAGGAIERLRMERIDLLVTVSALPDMPMDVFIATVRAAWPWQRWAIVGGVEDDRQEILARSLGVVRIFDDFPQANQLFKLVAADSKVSARVNAAAIPLRQGSGRSRTSHAPQIEQGFVTP